MSCDAFIVWGSCMLLDGQGVSLTFEAFDLSLSHFIDVVSFPSEVLFCCRANASSTLDLRAGKSPPKRWL